MNIYDTLERIENNNFSDTFEKLYGSSENVLCYQKQRYLNAVKCFEKVYPQRNDIRIFSAPGRTEIGGNHTDHQNGCVLAAAVDPDIIAVVSFHHDGVVRVKSEGYDAFTVKLDDLSVQENEKGSAALVRGVIAKFCSLGAEVGGFDIYCTSDVLSGSGISSSAAFEILIGTIVDTYYNENRAGAVEIAKIGQYAENVYFGKKSGLMDQMVASVGGLVSIDFYDTENPDIMSFNFDFEKYGYCLCITDTKGSHADLTDDYVTIRSEMESVAKYFGKEQLRQVDENAFYDAIFKLREKCSDRAILRASHFFSENNRALQEADALRNGDIEKFLRLVNKSGDSSAQLLQNLYSNSKPANQEIPLAIMMSKRILEGNGAVRVHGGGFAGTIQAFVPLKLEKRYMDEMDRIFGENSCRKLRIRPSGGVEII